MHHCTFHSETIWSCKRSRRTKYLLNAAAPKCHAPAREAPLFARIGGIVTAQKYNGGWRTQLRFFSKRARTREPPLVEREALSGRAAEVMCECVRWRGLDLIHTYAFSIHDDCR
jgi:hypothetical protein